MAFLDYRLKENIEYGADFGPGYKTDVSESASGYEYRDSRFSLPRYSGNIVPGIDQAGDFEDVLTLFHVARGRRNTWRFRDWTDYEIENEILGTLTTGAEETVQLGKSYSVAGQSFFRPIWRWVESTLIIKVDGEIDTDGTLDGETGIWTFGASTSPFLTPGAVVVIESGEFDLEVRFDIDRLPATLATFNLNKVSSIPIVEVRRGNG
jgi:uncharacterized protein (TIGR02217 family)